MIVFENNIEYLLAFISSLFGLSVPVMLQVIERVDQRYDSTRLAECLKSEQRIKICIYCLIWALISCTYAVFCRFPSPLDCWLLNNSADIIALASCISLITAFLLSCRIILKYYNPEYLQERLLKKYEKAETNEEKERFFMDWVDLTKVLLRASDREPAFRVYDTLGKEMKKIFDNAGLTGMVLPSYFVRGIISINENLCMMQRRPFSINNGNQILKNIISQPDKLSDEAYRLLWNNLQLQLFYGQEEWVFEYWSYAVQVFDLDLQMLYKGGSLFSNLEDAVTEDQVMRRNMERKRFLEFHITLCASILREKRYDLLEKIIDYIRIWPPEYPLVPSTMNDILEAFVTIEESPRFDMRVEGYYPMWGMKGIVDSAVMGSVKNYLTFLFIRMFSQIGRMLNTDVQYPNTLGKLKQMNENIEYIQKKMPSVLANDELLLLLSFDDKSDIANKAKETLDYIKKMIDEKQKDIKSNAPNDIDIVEKNLNKVKSIVNRSMRDYNSFMYASLGGDKVPYSLRGFKSVLYPNEAFQRDSGISYVNMADSVAEASIANIQHGFASVFYQNKQKSFKINSEEVFLAIDKLGVNENYVILAFDVYFDYYLHKNINGLKKEGNRIRYKKIPIICLHGGPTDLVSQSLFVLRKTDLPKLVFVDPVEEQKKECQLILLDKIYKLYGSIVQLSKNTRLLVGVDSMTEEKAKEHSVFNVFLQGKLYWKKNTKVVCIKLMYNMRDNGSTDSVNSIMTFENLLGGNIR